MTTIATNDHVLAHIIDRTPFANRQHSLWAELTSLPGNGEAPESVVDAIRDATRNYTEKVYVVYSYSTPIAWAREDDELLTVPDISYSITTSQHQGACLGGRPSVPINWDEKSVTTGRRVKMGDPGQVRKGRGHSPYTAHGGW